MDETEEIKSKLDIVDFLGEYLDLKKAGSNWKARCPFHNEKTPSLMVSRDRQMWHCFGCSVGGDVFTFLQKIDGLEFPEALKILAEKTGVKLTSKRNEVASSRKNRLIDINAKAAAWYHKVLAESNAGEEARKYLERRGVSEKMIDEFNLGYSPKSWDLLYKFFIKCGYGVDDIIASGLCARGNEGVFDRFRDRIMFPIKNVQGQYIGFTGRQLHENSEAGGKYVNTPETPVFVKGSVLYGLDKAKQEARALDYMIIVEGQMDVIACHQIGMRNVVAASGTALTAAQVSLIKRYTSNIRSAFDSDAAGVSAAKRGMDVALKNGLNVRAIILPSSAGKDPDECIKKDHAVWKSAVQDSVDIMEFYFNAVLNSDGRPDEGVFNDPVKKLKAAIELLEQIAKLGSPILQDHWTKELSSRVGIHESALREEMKKILRHVKYTGAAGGNVGAGIGSGAKGISKKSGTAPEEAPNTKNPMEQQYLALLIKFFSQIIQNRADWPDIFAPKEVITDSDYNAIYTKILLYYNGYDEKSRPDSFLGLSENLNNQQGIQEFLKLELLASSIETSDEETKKELPILIKNLLVRYKKMKRAELYALINAAEKKGDKEELNYLMQKFQNF